MLQTREQRVNRLGENKRHRPARRTIEFPLSTLFAGTSTGSAASILMLRTKGLAGIARMIDSRLLEYLEGGMCQGLRYVTIVLLEDDTILAMTAIGYACTMN